MTQATCPCGSAAAFALCCGRWLAGAPAPTAEALMRSRYSAYARGDIDYLMESWHPSTRPALLDLADSPAWSGLEIRACTGGGPADSEGSVEFLARFRSGGRAGSLHETSRFLREDGRWLYLDGHIHTPAAAGRNAPCPCGSGRKFKRCCAG